MNDPVIRNFQEDDSNTFIFMTIIRKLAVVTMVIKYILFTFIGHHFAIHDGGDLRYCY